MSKNKEEKVAKIAQFEWERKIVPLEALIPYEFNNKEHPEEQINVLANMIDTAWYLDEIIINKNNIIIAGHGRLETLKKMWYTDVEVKIVDIDETDAKALRLLHNKIAEMAQTNLENVSLELGSLEWYKVGDLPIEDLYPELVMPKNDDDYEEKPKEWDWLLYITVWVTDEMQKKVLLETLKELGYSNVR